MTRTTKNYKSLPYNSALSERAEELRKAGILHEVLFWNQVKSGKLNGLDFDRQKVIGDYIVDFYCAEKIPLLRLMVLHTLAGECTINSGMTFLYL